MSKICCGGFELGEGLELDGKVLKVSGGSGGVMVVNFTSTEDSLTADKTVAEILEAMKTGVVIGIVNGVAPIGAGIAGAESEVYFGQQYTDNGFAPLMVGTLGDYWTYIPQ